MCLGHALDALPLEKITMQPYSSMSGLVTLWIVLL